MAHYDCLFDKTDPWNLHGRVVEIDGLRIAGLAGNFQAGIWYPPEPPRFARRTDYLAICGRGNRWRDGLPLKRRGAIWRQDYDALSSQRADVLVTHEAPGYHRYGFDVLGDLAAAMGCGYLFHGHLHERYNATLASGLKIRGLGLCDVVDLQGNAIRGYGD